MPTLYKCISFTSVEVPWGERQCLTHLHILLFFISPNLTPRILQSFVHNRCLKHFCWPCWALYEYFVESDSSLSISLRKISAKATYWLRWKSYVRSIVSIETPCSAFSFHPFLLEFHNEHRTKLLSRHPATQVHEVSLNQRFLWLGQHNFSGGDGDVLLVPGSACTNTAVCGGPSPVRSAIAAPTFRRRFEWSRNDGGHGGGQRVKVLLPAASAVDTSPSWIRGTRKFMRGRTGGRSFLWHDPWVTVLFDCLQYCEERTRLYGEDWWTYIIWEKKLPGDKQHVWCFKKEVCRGGRQWLPWWKHVLQPVFYVSTSVRKRYAGITIYVRSAVSVWGKFIRATKCTRPSNEGDEQQYPSVKSQLITRHSVTEPRHANNRGTNNVTSHASISKQGYFAYES